LLFDWLVPLLTGAVPLPTGAPAPIQLQALLCKTLAYALQQLPSCADPTSGQGARAPAGPASAQSVVTAPGAAVDSTPAAAPAAAAAGKAKLLLTVPVPLVAAEQLRQHAAVVMRAVQQLLEAVSTPPELLGPLLQLLLEVIRLAHTVVTGGPRHSCILFVAHAVLCLQPCNIPPLHSACSSVQGASDPCIFLNSCITGWFLC
jgi:hypothetical protein